MRRMTFFGAAGIGFGALAVPGCGGGGPDVAEEPLGWSGPVDATEARLWSAESLEAAPRWTVAESPAMVMVPDSSEAVVYGRSGEVLHRSESQRYPEQAVFLPDGRVVVAYYLSPSDSILLHFLDPVAGTDTPIAAPGGEEDEELHWGHTGGLALYADGIVLRADNAPVGTRRRGSDIWYVDLEGRFTRPSSYINARGSLLGAFADGSVAAFGRLDRVDTTLVLPVLSVLPMAAGGEPSDAHRAEVLFALAAPGDPARGYESLAGWSHHPGRTTALAGETFWTVPTERPELFAVDRSGEVALRIEWDAGDRSVPAGAAEFWEGAQRIPAAANLLIGTDGRVYVQRWTVRDDRPVRGPEWLVFDQAGQLAARLDVPSNWRVLAFGDGTLVAAVYTDSDFQEVRAYALDGAG